jgi:hypothetical protein
MGAIGGIVGGITAIGFGVGAGVLVRDGLNSVLPGFLMGWPHLIIGTLAGLAVIRMSWKETMSLGAKTIPL